MGLNFQKKSTGQKILWGGGALVLLVFAVLAVNAFMSPREVLEEQMVDSPQQNNNEAPQEAPHSVFGTVKEADTAHIVVAVLIGGVTVPFSFAYTSQTEFYSFAYVNDDDLVGTQTSITPKELRVGDTVAVYTSKGLSSARTEPATKVIKTK